MERFDWMEYFFASNKIEHYNNHSGQQMGFKQTQADWILEML